MLQVLIGLAAVDDSILTAIDLEQEQHVVLVDLALVVTLHKFVDCVLDLLQVIKLSRGRPIRRVISRFSLNISINALLFDEVALKQPIVKLDLRQFLQIIESSIAKLT